MDITFYCGNCGQRILLDETRAQEEIKCPACGSTDHAPPSLIPQHRTNPKLRLRKTGVDAPPLAVGPPCPKCAEPMMSEDAIICVHCGYNTQTGTKMGAEPATPRQGTRLSWVIWLVVLLVLGAAIGGYLLFVR